ncbi:MAG TPA: hypothetical protein VIQ11_01365 [Mycobacterium sp.]
MTERDRKHTVRVPDGMTVVRYWDQIKPTAQHRLVDDAIDAILRDVLQGKKDHLRDQMRAVAYKRIRQHHGWPYFEECVEKAVGERTKTAEAKIARVVALAGHWLRPRDHAMDEYTEATIHAAKSVLAALADPVTTDHAAQKLAEMRDLRGISTTEHEEI